MIRNQIDKNNAAITDWAKLGNDLTGSAIGAIIGNCFGGSEGAVIGASITPLITESISKIGYEFKNIVFGKREEVRVGATFSFTLEKIKERLDAGDTPRDNSFFTGTNGNRAASEEILEAALRLAQKEHEELKIKHYGYLIANIYFDERIDRGYANLLLSIADRLSYRKLLLLEIFSNTAKFDLHRKNVSDIEDDTRPKIVNGDDFSLYDSSKLTLRGLLKNRKIDLYTEVNELNNNQLIDTQAGFPLSKLGESYELVVLTEIGLQLRRLMVLKDLSKDDLEEVASILR